jgi:hypothetical protein
LIWVRRWSFLQQSLGPLSRRLGPFDVDLVSLLGGRSQNRYAVRLHFHASTANGKRTLIVAQPEPQLPGCQSSQ